MNRVILLNMPIGHMADMSTRVHEALRSGTHFAVEDTRTFREFLGRLGLTSEGKHIHSLHDQSSEEKWDRLLEVVWQGHDLFVCSEAGSPILSDPGFPLVRLAQQKGIEIETYSGVTSVVAALELSGLPPIPFSFHGFLARDEGRIKSYFEQLGNGTHIFFEAPGRIRRTLEVALEVWPEAEFSVVKEIGKTYQKVIRFKAESFKEFDAVMERGEFVWLVHLPNDTRPKVPQDITHEAQEILNGGVGQKGVSKLLGLILDRPAKEIYSELNTHK